MTSNFFFSHNVFHSYISLVHQNVALCGNGLNLKSLGEKEKQYSRQQWVNIDHELQSIAKIN